MKFEQKDFIPTTIEDIENHIDLNPANIPTPENTRKVILKLGRHIIFPYIIMLK